MRLWAFLGLKMHFIAKTFSPTPSLSALCLRMHAAAHAIQETMEMHTLQPLTWSKPDDMHRGRREISMERSVEHTRTCL